MSQIEQVYLQQIIADNEEINILGGQNSIIEPSSDIALQELKKVRFWRNKLTFPSNDVEYFIANITDNYEGIANTDYSFTITKTNSLTLKPILSGVDADIYLSFFYKSSSRPYFSISRFNNTSNRVVTSNFSSLNSTGGSWKLVIVYLSHTNFSTSQTENIILKTADASLSVKNIVLANQSSQSYLIESNYLYYKNNLQFTSDLLPDLSLGNNSYKNNNIKLPLSFSILNQPFQISPTYFYLNGQQYILKDNEEYEIPEIDFSIIQLIKIGPDVGVDLAYSKIVNLTPLGQEIEEQEE